MASVDSKTKEKLLSVYGSMSKVTIPEKGDGWVNLAALGDALKKAGIDFRLLGFEKLAAFVSSSGLFDLWIDQTIKYPVKYIRVKQNSQNTARSHQKATSVEKNRGSFSNRTQELLDIWNLDEPIAVGYFQILQDGRYQISDFRSESFRELRYPDLEQQSQVNETEVIIIVEKAISNTYKSNKYYKFSWTTEKCQDERGYRVIPSHPIRLKNINPQELIKTLHDIWNNPDAAEQMKNVMNMVSTELMASSDGTFIYELLQNANDNAVVDKDGKVEPVDVEFHITDNYLICRHTGDYFSPRDIAGVCKLADGAKKFRKNAIGYKGIGFKTVFHSHGWVYILSNDYSFHFSENRNRPWQIMPIWEYPKDLDPEIKTVIEKNRERFRVVTVMKPRNKSLLRDLEGKNYKFLLSDIFKDVRDIIFIPNINSVKVFDNGKVLASCQYDESCSWKRSSLTPYSLESIQDEINKEIILHPERGIPGKYKDFGDTTVAFACECKENKLIAVKNATVNCYLPTKAEFGFPFLMNTDMIPTGPRDQLKLDVEFNAQFAYISGVKFVEWMKSLIEEGFDASTVFDLIPDFEECKSGIGKFYSLFIAKFEEGFYNECKTVEFIPTVSKDGVIGLSKISDILYDSTRITMSGIMSDEEFYSITGVTAVQPIIDIRSNKNLRELINHIGINHRFDQTKLVALCENVAFQNWLKVQDNNNKWIGFIIDSNQANLFVHKKIFINDRTNELEESSSLRYNSKSFRKDLSCFVSKYLNCVTDDTFNFLEQEEQKRYKSLEKAGFTWSLFYPYTFAETVLNCKEDVELLKSLDNSVGFYHMMASVYEQCFPGNFANICKKFPLIVDGTVLDSIEGYVLYFDCQEGLSYKSKSWVDDSWLYFLPKEYIEYDKDVMEPFFKHYVSSFTETNFISNILLKSDYIITINNKISERYEDNLDFYRLMYKYREGDTINDGSLQHFCLHALKINGESTYVIPKESPVYFNSIAYEEFIKRPWLENEWLYSFDVSYLRDLGDSSEESKKSIIDFFEKKCRVRISQKAKLCTEVAMAHLSQILQAINMPKEDTDNNGPCVSADIIKNNNFDFLHYLSENYSTVFEGNTNYFNDKSFPFIDSEGKYTNGPLYVKRFYSVSSDIDEISSLTWLPDDFVKVISNEYIKSFDDFQRYTTLTKKMGIYDFDYNGFLAEVILPHKQEIINRIKEIGANISFHKFFRNHIDKITPDNIKKLADFPVFIIGDNAPILSPSSKGHLLTDNRITALINQGFLPASSIDGICEAYFEDNDKDKIYWVETLENREINIPAIISLLTGLSTIDSVKQNISKSVEDNVRFWRLLFSFKDIKSANLTLLKSLPIIMKKGSETEYSLHTLGEDEECYVSDSYYSDGGAIEYLVNEYAKNSWLLSPVYIQNQPTESKKDWLVFWQKVGILSSNEDILLHTIIPHLDENVNEKIPILLYNNKTLIEERINDKMKEDFKQLHLCTKNGLRKISDVYFIQEDNNKLLNEPLPEFPLSNQISPSYSKDQVAFFLSLTDLSLSVITTQAEWFEPKIDQYLSYQEKAFNNSLDSTIRESNLKIIDAIHYEFIKNLAKFKLYNNTLLLAL